MNDSVLCVGEVLWDSMPAGLFLGGAPYNVCFHLHRLGCAATVVSRVGDDVLGREALRRIADCGLSTDLVQIDPTLPTGFVKVKVDSDGIPEYEIVQPVAWDELELNEVLRDRASEARAVVFGSLAQRQETSRETVQALCDAGALTVFDVNLRKPFVSKTLIRASLDAADFVKLNAEELRQMSGWFDLPHDLRGATSVLAGRFGCRLVCVTRGGDGAALWHEGRWSEHSGHPTDVRDTVGAGDAFLSALLVAVLDGRADEDALDSACRLGSYIASQSGATPNYDIEALPELALTSS